MDEKISGIGGKNMSSTLDELTIDELMKLNSLGFVVITGNGHVAAVCEEDQAERFEKERTEHGY